MDIQNNSYYVKKNKVEGLRDFQYSNKFKSAIIAFLLFIILSNKLSYKVLNLILTSFNNNIQIIDEDENPLFLGTIMLGVIVGIIIFIF